jgi:hypothetical protein
MMEGSARGAERDLAKDAYSVHGVGQVSKLGQDSVIRVAAGFLLPSLKFLLEQLRI